MMDKRFSSEEFEKRGTDTPEARALADALAHEIEKEINELIAPHFLRIVERLNNMGHHLQDGADPSIGEVFRYLDDTVQTPPQWHRLLVGIDVVVSTGYAHLMDPDVSLLDFEEDEPDY